jgi:hypothetical protein
VLSACCKEGSTTVNYGMPLVISRIDIKHVRLHVIISMPHRHRNCGVGPALPNLLPPVCHQRDLYNCL